jgi:hypothetical protein
MDSRTKHLEIPLNGKLITSEPAGIGTNFRSLMNLRYTDTHPKAVAGMTKINANIMDAVYHHPKSAFHFMKSQPSESHVIVQAESAAGTLASLVENLTAIASAGEFGADELWTDSTGFGRGYFSNASDGQMIYANGVDTCIWGGAQTKCGAVIAGTVALSAPTDVPTNPKDYTEQMNNTKTDSANVFTVAATANTTFLVGSTRPAKGATITFTATVNTTANTLVIKESASGVWNTITATSDGTRNVGDTASFTKTGKILWPTTVATTKPKYLEGYYLYWYQFTINDGSAVISHITLDLPFQPIVDMWDGVYRSVSRFYKTTAAQLDNTLNVLEDDYDASSVSTYSDVSSLVATTQYLEVGFGEKMTGLFFSLPPDYINTHAAAIAAVGTISVTSTCVTSETFLIDTQTFTFVGTRSGVGEVTVGADASACCAFIVTAVNLDLDTVVAADAAGDTVTVTAVIAGTDGNAIDFTETTAHITMDGTGHLGGTIAGANAGAVSIDYWTGSAYSSVGSVSDGTAITGASLGRSGVMSWNNTSLASEQKKQYANAIPLYYYRVKFDHDLDASVRINYVAGITASKEISYFKFPVFAQGRVLLCADLSGEKNMAKCSSQYMPQVYNGSDSVDLYFGEEGELTCGTELFSQFGSSLYSLILMFKDSEMWVTAGQDIDAWSSNTFLLSNTIGCPAPLTLKTINLSAEPGAGINRALAIWQGANGVYMSDGRAPIPIHGDIKEYFDRSDSRCIGASTVGDSVGFIDPEKQEYHWLFWSGEGEGAIRKELVYDIHRNRWFEIDRMGTWGKSTRDLVCGLTVHDIYGNSYCYGFIESGYMERLEYGLTFDGNDIEYEMSLGDFAPMGLAYETRISAIKLITVAKTGTPGDITCTHYSDTSTTGTDKTMSQAKAGYRLAYPGWQEKLNSDPFHSLKFKITNVDDTIGFEPLAIIVAYHSTHQQ